MRTKNDIIIEWIIGSIMYIVGFILFIYMYGNWYIFIYEMFIEGYKNRSIQIISLSIFIFLFTTIISVGLLSFFIGPFLTRKNVRKVKRIKDFTDTDIAEFNFKSFRLFFLDKQYEVLKEMSDNDIKLLNSEQQKAYFKMLIELKRIRLNEKMAREDENI